MFACQEDEELSYKDGPCCPVCVPSPEKCSKKEVSGTMNLTVNGVNFVSDQIIKYHVCEGSCGISTSVPVLVRNNNNDETGFEVSSTHYSNTLF